MSIMRIYAEIENHRIKKVHEGALRSRAGLTLEDLYIMAGDVVNEIIAKETKEAVTGHIRVGKVWYTAEEYRKKFGAGSPAENKD